jgi:hypothetical protein
MPPFSSAQVISSNTADAETRQKAAIEKEESLKGLSAQIEARPESLFQQDSRAGALLCITYLPWPLGRGLLLRASDPHWLLMTG